VQRGGGRTPGTSKGGSVSGCSAGPLARRCALLYRNTSVAGSSSAPCAAGARAGSLSARNCAGAGMQYGVRPRRQPPPTGGRACCACGAPRRRQGGHTGRRARGPSARDRPVRQHKRVCHQAWESRRLQAGCGNAARAPRARAARARGAARSGRGRARAGALGRRYADSGCRASRGVPLTMRICSLAAMSVSVASACCTASTLAAAARACQAAQPLPGARGRCVGRARAARAGRPAADRRWGV